jgi:hypothetical protein
MGPLLQKEAKHGTGGAERQFFLFGKALAKRGWQVNFIADYKGPVRQIHANVQVIHVLFSHLGGQKIWMLMELPQLMIVLLCLHPRFVVLKTATHLAGVVLLCRLFSRCELIMWAQTSTSFSRVIAGEPCWVRWMRWISLKYAKILIAQTKAQVLAAKIDFGREANIVPNIIEQTTSRDEIQKNYIFWCGNNLANKRAEVFLELALLMPQEQFVMTMNGNVQSERYQNIKLSADRIANLNFLGSVPSDEIDDWFAGAKVYVHTAIREGFPNTYLQAWQQGCPVVSINIDPDNNLETERIGLCLYKDNSHETESFVKLARSINRGLESFIYDGERLEQYKKTCRSYIERTHEEGFVVNMLESLLCDETYL